MGGEQYRYFLKYHTHAKKDLNYDILKAEQSHQAAFTSKPFSPHLGNTVYI